MRAITFVYCDTDSVKYIGDIDFTEYNAKRIADSTFRGAFADDPCGKRHYMGVYEQERSYYTFKTMGAKKYAYTYGAGGETHVTIAGVSKKLGGRELDRAGKTNGKTGLEMMEEGFVFTEAGGLESVYHDMCHEKIWMNGEFVTITDNVTLKPSTYELGLESDYRVLLKLCEAENLRELQNG